ANEGYTAGSNSVHMSGTAVQHAAAQVRGLLVAESARRLDLPVENLRTENGAVIAPDGRRFGYGDLVAAELLHVQAQPAKHKEFQAIKAMNALSAAAKWKETSGLPKQDDLLRVVTNFPSQDSTIFQQGNPSVVGQKTIEATYTRPYLAHGSIGPSCAVAQFTD